jgi:phage-related protein
LFVRHCLLRVRLHRQCRREIAELPERIRGELADGLARLDAGLPLSMPLSRPMPSIGRGAHELRLRDRSGDYRIVYIVTQSGEIVVVLAFKKMTSKTPGRMIRLARSRARESG